MSRNALIGICMAAVSLGAIAQIPISALRDIIFSLNHVQ